MFGSLWRTVPTRVTQMVPGTPTASNDRKGIAVVAIMKDEASHLLDWIMFHTLAGVSHFFLYDDGSTDGSRQAAESFLGASVVVIPWKLTVALVKPKIGLSRQVLAYCHAIENFGSDFRWMAFIDIDEYIVPKNHHTITSALAGVQDKACISLPWTMFGPDDHIETPNLPAPFAYTRCKRPQAGVLLNFKCIVDPCDVTQVRVHHFCTASMGKKTANEKGRTVYYRNRDKPDFLSSDNLQLNHYYTRSFRDFERKLAKGSASGHNAKSHFKATIEKGELLGAGLEVDSAAADFLMMHGIRSPEDFRGKILT